MAQDLRTIFDDDPLRILYAEGRTKTLVVSCAGVGNDPKVFPPPEFPALAMHGGDNHVLFVSDNSRSWLNAPGLAERIVETIEATAAEINAERIVGIGNSMGATMLLHLSQLTDFDAVLAFTPQYSADPACVPEETRWRRFRRTINEFRFAEVSQLRHDRTYYTILHGDTEDELIHALRFPLVNGVSHMILPGFCHRLAYRLKEEGHLSALANLAITGRYSRLRKKLIRLGAVRRNSFERMKDAAQPHHLGDVA